MPTEERPRLRLPITFERGINEYLEESQLPDGASPQMDNWEASPTGEARTRAAWSKGSTTSAPATRKGVGIGYFTRVIYPGIVQVSDVVTGDSGGGSTSTLAPSWKVPTTKGNTLFFAVITSSDNLTATIPAPTPGNWVEAVENGPLALARPRVDLFYVENSPIQSGAVSVAITNLGVNTATFAQMVEVSGIATSSSLDKTNSDTQAADATPQSGTTAATTQAVEFVVALIGDQRREAQTLPTNFFSKISETQIDTAGNDLTAGVYFKTTSATGAQALSVTTATADACGGCIATFKSWFTGTPAAGQTSDTKMLVAQDDTGNNEYDFYVIDRENLGAGTWSALTSITTVDASQLVAMAPGMGRTFLANRQFPSLFVYDGLTLSALADSPGGRAVAVHKNRVYVSGRDGEPGRLRFSDIGDYTTFGANSFIDVSFGDGEPIEDITPQQDLLIIGKRTGLWQLAGSGPDTFVLQKLAVGGLAPGRTLTPTPYGTVAAGRAAIWLINSGEVSRISLPISDSYLWASDFFTGSYIDDTYYICSYATGTVYALNMQTGTWRTEKVSSASTEGPSCIYNHDQTQFFSPKAATVGGLLNYRNFPVTTRAKDFDTLSEVFTARTPEIFPVGPEEAFTAKHLYLRIRQHAGDGTSAMTVSPVYIKQNGTSSAGTVHTVTSKAGNGVFRERIDLGNVSGVCGVRFTFAYTVASTFGGVFDLEEVTLEYEVERVR